MINRVICININTIRSHQSYFKPHIQPFRKWKYVTTYQNVVKLKNPIAGKNVSPWRTIRNSVQAADPNRLHKF